MTARRLAKLFRVFACACALAYALPAGAAFDVYFLRHGQTDWNRERRLQGSVPHPKLTEEGRRIAESTGSGMAAAGLRFDRIYTSPYVRARETAELVAQKTGPKPVVDDRLREMCFGKYEGVLYGKGNYPDENLRVFFEGDAEKYVPQGESAESFAQVQARLRDFLEKELKPRDGKVSRVLCVAHSLVLKSLVRELAGDGASAAAKKALQPNCCVHVVRYEGGKFSLVETGRTYYGKEEPGRVSGMTPADALRRDFPEITAVARKVVGDGDKKAENVLAQWAAARDEAVKGGEDKTYTCVDFTLRPEAGSEIRCQMLLPSAEAWDGRMWGVGNSGWAGCLPKGLWRYPAVGTAVVTTDLGTGRITNNGKTNDHAWPACVIRDFDWRATHLMTEYGVRLCAAFYGRAPHHKYFCGGSCGGRQAMSEAIRFPHDYDAIIANLPANGGVAKEAAMFHLRKVAYDTEKNALRFTTNEMRIVANAACELKGVKVLDDPRFTEAEIDAFLELAAKKAPRLAEPDLKARLKSLYMPVYVQGKCVFNGFAPGTYSGKNMGWTKFLRFANFLKGKGYAATADYTRGTWEQFAEFAREEGPSFNACSPDLSAFRKAGGKLLMTAGLEDQTIPPFLIMDYYDTVCEADGGIEETMKYFSLWCLPGCAHGGGKGRIMTCPPNSMRIHDMLVRWREKGVRPTNVYPGWEYGGPTRRTGGYARIDPAFCTTAMEDL